MVVSYNQPAARIAAQIWGQATAIKMIAKSAIEG
jgi:hypothetical protein